MSEVGYTLQAVHEGTLKPIVWLRVSERQASEIMRALWPDVDFWAAPGGASMAVASEAEARTISKVLGGCGIAFDPDRHRWHFHVHLV